jgi:alkaline phosphatase D
MSRRRFVASVGMSAAAWPAFAIAQRASDEGRERFRHGVASGDPLADRVVLWTRVTPRAGSSGVEVRWQIADDETFRRVVARGSVQTDAARDFTVKVDATGLSAGRTYYFAFEAAGERSTVGRTRTMAPDTADRLRLAAVSCSNYPAGYFNVYRCIADRDDLDLVLHLGDYIYEFANGVYGDGSKQDRIPVPIAEAVTLDDYRRRYASYRTDADLQEAHRRHPFIAIWDDHELANNAWSGGAEDHTAEKGSWSARRAAATRAYLEWMPVRESRGEFALYRSFRCGGLADLILLDTRSLRDRQVAGDDVAGLGDAARSILGRAQENWLFDRLRASRRDGAAWRLIGQQVLFAPITPAGFKVQNVDAWDGYPAARRRVLDFLRTERLPDMAILTGDIHSSWAMDVPPGPQVGQPSAGTDSLAVEIVTPAISSPPLFTIEGAREAVPLVRLVSPHIKYLEGDRNGYVVAEVTRARLTADWYHVPSVTERTARESHGARYVCERGSSRLVAG